MIYFILIEYSNAMSRTKKMKTFSCREPSLGGRRRKISFFLLCERHAELKVSSARLSTVKKEHIRKLLSDMAEAAEQSANEVVTRRTILRLQHGNIMW